MRTSGAARREATHRSPIAKRPGQGKTALITGASGGIGYELALLFARDGYDLVLVARSKDKLVALADRLERDHGVSVRTLSKDLTQPESPGEIHSELDSQSVRVDVLVTTPDSVSGASLPRHPSRTSWRWWSSTWVRSPA